MLVSIWAWGTGWARVSSFLGQQRCGAKLVAMVKGLDGSGEGAVGCRSMLGGCGSRMGHEEARSGEEESGNLNFWASLGGAELGLMGGGPMDSGWVK